MTAIAWSGRSSIPVRCSAPWPDDITCGVTMANPPTIAPPMVGRRSAGSLTRSRSVSKKLTPIITTMPNSAIARPTSAANTRSWLVTMVTWGATMPSFTGARLPATE